MKRIFCFLLLLCPYLGFAQGNVKQVRMGEKVPEIIFKQVLNSPASTIKLSQLKGKWVLLDFWAAWCSSCLKKMSLLDSLQRQYAGKLQVILVSGNGSRDGKAIIEAYLDRHRNASGKRFAMPAAIYDTIASKYFPHRAVPHYAWIDKAGTCIATSGSEEVTAANISKLLKGEQPDINGLALMDDFDFETPLFINGNAGDGSGLLARSTLSRYIPGMAPLARYSRNDQKLVTQYKLINQPLVELVKKAYDVNLPNQRIVSQVADSVKQILLPPDARKKAGSYAYELLCPPQPYSHALKLVQQDMERYFGLCARWDSLPAPCYFLTVDTAVLQPRLSKGGKSINRLYDPGNKYLQNGKLKSLADYLNNTLQRYVLLQTSLPYLVDISLPDTNDEGALLEALAKQGIVLTAGTATIPQFVIYQSPKQNL